MTTSTTRLMEYVTEELGEFMSPDWLGRDVSLNDLWRLNRTLIVTYENDYMEADNEYLWSEVSGQTFNT